MSDEATARRLDRRELLRYGGWGALTLAAGGALANVARGHSGPTRVAPKSAGVRSLAGAAAAQKRFVATDGHILLPGRDPLYVFGFVDVGPDLLNAPVEDLVVAHKGKVKLPAPILAVDENVDFYLTLTNVGLQFRPDLSDSHTIHWHGFRNPLALFDGVPEVSISVPPNRDFPYFYRPEDEGTYMYHCHFEDTEHVQMGMDGIVYVRPTLGPKFAYNDASTAFDREYTLLLNEIDTHPHDGLEAIQEFVWTDYKANYWVINGRCYPDTVKASLDVSLELEPDFVPQPVSSLIQAKEGQKVLLRFASLGYEQHAMQCPGIPFKVVGEDATLLRGPGGADLSYWTNTLYIGPGEARDVIFTAPAFDPTAGETDPDDSNGEFNRYLLRNRRYQALTNPGVSGLGGMATEVRVYEPSVSLPNQTTANEVFL